MTDCKNCTALRAEAERLRAALIAVRPHLVAATCELLLHPPQPQEALDMVDAALNDQPEIREKEV